MTIIKFNNVSHGGILHNMTGDFRESRITTFVGPSGAGKTTCQKHINGLLSPDGGAVYYRGENLADIDIIELRKEVGMAFQSSPMIAGTVFDNLNLPREIFGDTLSGERAKSLLEMVDLEEIPLTQNVKSLSGGERSRVSIARTFVNRPRVLLLDEVTSSLDYTLVKEIERLVVRLQREENVTVVWITHDLDQARRVSDDMWFLRAGELLEFGDASFIDETGNEEIRQFVRGEAL